MTHSVARLVTCAVTCPTHAFARKQHLTPQTTASFSPKRTLFVELSGLFNFVVCHCSVVVLSLLSLFLSTQVRAFLP